MSVAATIVIPLKNQRDEWLEQCVASAVAQSVACEVIVVGSAKTPESNVAVLDGLQTQWSNLRVLMEEKPGSFPGAINLGIRNATAPRLGLLLSDDWLDREAVANCLPLTADIVSTGVAVYLEDGKTIHPKACLNTSLAEYRKLTSMEARARYLQHFFLFQRQTLLRVGGLDETIGNFPGIDDYDLIWTLLEHGASVAIVEKALYNYRDHDGERLTLADAGQAVRNLEKILRKHRVPEAEMERVIGEHARWYGRTMHDVLAEDS